MIVMRYSNADQSADIVKDANGNTKTDGGLITAIEDSLLTNAPAKPGDPVPPDAPREGWWGDAYAEVPGDVRGSRLWIIQMLADNAETEALARTYAEEALEWLVTDGVSDRVEVLLDRPGDGSIWITVDVYKPGELTPETAGPWNLMELWNG